jgi:hypothetical protein
VDTPLGNGAIVNPGEIAMNGAGIRGIFIHPPYLGQIGGETFIEYSLPVPPRAILQFSVGVQADALCGDGVTFRVTAGGTELWQQHVPQAVFRDGVLRLDAYSGSTVPLRLISHPGPANNPNCDWAWWIRLALGAVPDSGG